MQRAEAPDGQPIPGAQAPGACQSGLDHDLVAALGHVPAGDDRVAAPAAADDVDDALRERVTRCGQLDARDLGAVRARGEVWQRSHARVHAGAVLIGEARDHRRQVGALGGAIEARAQPVGGADHHTEHERCGEHHARGQRRAPAPRAQAQQRVREQRPHGPASAWSSSWGPLASAA